jgi:hypothetical protein
MISNWLYILYLENKSGSSQLDKLLGNGNKQKAVFQFYRDKAGVLGLTGWPGKQGNKDFILKDTVQLKRGDYSGVSLYNKEVFLADLQLGKNAAKALQDRINKPDRDSSKYNFILFIPSIKEDPKTHVNYVIYTVEGSSSPQKMGPALASIALLNPSPPRNVDEDY